LFGGADKEVADVISRRVLDLDSLLGPDITGCIFAKYATVHSHVTKTQRVPGPVFVDKFTRIKSASDLDRLIPIDITATSYGSDEVARHFQLTADLPCMVILDGHPTSEITIIPLHDIDPEEIHSFIRASLGLFRSKPVELGLYNDLLVKTRAECKQFARCVQLLADAEDYLQKAEERYEKVMAGLQGANLMNWEREATQALFDADIVRFKELVDLLPSPFSQNTEFVFAAASESERTLRALNKTIMTLQILHQYDRTVTVDEAISNVNKFPIPKKSQKRLQAKIGELSAHLATLTPIGVDISLHDSETSIQKLVSFRNDLIKRVLANIVRLHELQYLEPQQTSEIKNARDRVSTAKDEMRATEATLSDYFHNSGEWPSLQKSFQESLRKRNRLVKRKEIGTAALSWLQEIFSAKSLLEISKIIFGGK
jgi:hypothetical protein